MKVSCLNTIEDIFKAICAGCKVLCIDLDYPDAYLVNSMKVCEIVDYIDDSSSCHIFISVEDL